MIHVERLSKWIAIVLIALVLGYFVFDNFVLSPQRQAVFHGSVTLSWAAPIENEDNSPLTDLAGYVIYYGTRAGQYSYRIHVDNPKTTGYKLENLSPGTYYFVMTAINTDGAESAMSDMIKKTVP